MISVVACTNREEFLPNLIRNFQKQTLNKKELLLVLHSLRIDHRKWKDVLESANIEYTLLNFSEELSLGECLNEAAILAKYHFISKMDDDDYYGGDYLREAYHALTQTDVMMVGKAAFYIYFKQKQELRLMNPNWENTWIKNNIPNHISCLVSGATLTFKKELLNTVSFPPTNQGEDSGFQKLCLESGGKILSLSKKNYVYMRYSNLSHHNSDATDQLLKRHSVFVSKTAHFETIVNKF